MGQACSTYGERRGAYRDLVRQREGRRLLRRTRCRWGDNIKMDLREMGWGTWAELVWLSIGIDRGESYKCGNEPWGYIKCGEFLEWLRNC